MTISVNNAVYAVLFLILAFFSSMCILFLLNIDYLALMFILIYIVAVFELIVLSEIIDAIKSKVTLKIL